MEFKIRCHRIATIMTEPKAKSEKLSVGAKTYVQEKLQNKVYDIEPVELNTKEIKKGLLCEDAAIDFAQAIMEPGGMWFKNEMHFEDDYIRGTPDLIVGKAVYDIKCSWDHLTFPLFSDKPKNDYWWQLQGYMALTGCERAAVLYCLMDTPDDLVYQEARALSFARGLGGDTEQTFEEVKFKHTFSRYPVELRFKAFEVERDEAAIQSIRDKVEACREYIQDLLRKV